MEIRSNGMLNTSFTLVAFDSTKDEAGVFQNGDCRSIWAETGD
jgi:hypothetical protein